jgi:hypothetical protein
MQIIRELSPPVAAFAARHKVVLGLINNGSLILIVWQVSMPQTSRSLLTPHPSRRLCSGTHEGEGEGEGAVEDGMRRIALHLF